MNFSTYHGIFWKLRPLKNTTSEISMVGRSGCGLSINMKYVGEGTNTAQNFGYFPACNAVVMLKNRGKAGMH